MRLSVRVCFVCVTIILCVCVCFCVFFRRLRANLALCWMFRSRSVEGFVSVTPGGYFRRTARFVSLFLSLSPSLSFCYYIKFYSDSDSDPRRVTRRFRIANHMVMDSCCRGGIVDTRGGCSRALFVPPKSPTALWRFRASTSNSLSGRFGCTLARICRIFYQTYAQQDIRVCGDDHFEPPKRQYRIPRRFASSRKYLRHSS